jgi:hypothetical protein
MALELIFVSARTNKRHHHHHEFCPYNHNMDEISSILSLYGRQERILPIVTSLQTRGARARTCVYPGIRCMVCSVFYEVVCISYQFQHISYQF